MIDLRKIAIIFVIAILFSIFAFTFVDAVNPDPDRLDYCQDEFKSRLPLPPERIPLSCPDLEPTRAEQKTCSENSGHLQFEYDENDCPVSYECTCREGYKSAREKNNLIDFIIFTAFALVAILIGLFLPSSKNTLNEWVGTGFMLGGLITLFVGTFRFFGDLAKPLRPVVILIELIIVLFLAYKKLGGIREKHKR